MLYRIALKLGSWKTKYLTLVGRHTLAQSVLTSIPLYNMLTALLPFGVCNIIDKLVRKFLWGQWNGQKKVHLINWETITRGKDQGGLGIKRMCAMNTALLAKLGWRIFTKKKKKTMGENNH